MFKKSYNRAVLHIRVETLTPLRIGAGDAGLHPTAASLACVRTRHARYGTTVFIPGSSLKGVLRSAAETAVRGRKFGEGISGACDPLHEEMSCGKLKQQDDNSSADRKSILSHDVYRQQCLACRLFGSLRLKGRTGVRDLFPWTEAESAAPEIRPNGDNSLRANQIEIRYGISIDRILGSVKHGPFDQELVPAGISFFGDISLENYQAWQLGLLVQAFSEVNDGFAQLGSSKSRGLGVVRVDVDSILHEQALTENVKPVGVGLLASQREQEDYGLFRDNELADLPGKIHGLSRRFSIVDDASIRTWLDSGLQALGGLQ